MARRTGRNNAPGTTATASTPEGELLRHLKDLGLESAEAYRIWCRENGFGVALNKGWQEQRAERMLAEKQRQESSARRDIEAHYRSLGMQTEAEYLAWCRQNGFPAAICKRPQQKREEWMSRQRGRSDAALNSTRRFARKPDEMLHALAAGTMYTDSLKSPHLCAIQAAFAGMGDETPLRESFLRLLLHCRKSTRLLNCDPAIAYLGPQAGNTWISGLLELAKHHARWRNVPETWKPDSHNAQRQFATLARHLLAKYDVPAFLDAACLEGDTPRARQHQGWFLHIGGGQNIRTADLGIALTRRGAHLFSQAPRDLPIESALRWAQVHSLGGDEPLARSLLTTRLSEVQDDEPFWQSVLFFFINNPMLDSARIASIVDFVYHRRFVPAEVTNPEGEVIGMAIPEPHFSMKGRTGLALIARVEEWHRALVRESKRPPLEWASSGIGGFSWMHRDTAAKMDVTWTVEEILSSKVLQEEGKVMRHCVASYAPSCARGSISIWTVQIQEGAEAAKRRVMTVEVNNARRAVVQARGRCNKAPGEKRASPRLDFAPDILRRWADQQNLTVPSHI